MIFALSTARAQFTYSEDFKNATAAGWILNPAGNSTPAPILTSGAATRSGDPESGTIDPSGSGWLRLTNNTLNTHNAVYFDTPIPSAGNSVTIQFGVNLFGGNNFANTGADGLTFFLYDASKTFQVGADGGSIGYAQKTGVNGMNGGFVAVALDAYGNFSVAGEGRVGGTASLLPNSLSVRGPGQGTSGYNFLAATGNRDLTDTGSPTVLDAGDGTVPSLPYTMAFPTATARPNQSTQYRNVSVTIDANSQLIVSMQFGEDGLWYNMLNVDLSSFVRPEQLKMGFSAGTGSGTLITEVGGLLSINATAGSGNFIWDNGQGPSNKVWGTGASDPLNWAGNTNPTLKSNVLFNSTYISSAQNIDVTGSDKVIQNMYFSGANSYTLSTSEARKLIFDSATIGGLTTLNLTNDVSGNTSHTVALDVQMNRALDINNNIAPTFTISGNIDNGGNTLSLKGTGNTVLSGVISGTGALVKADSGTTILSGASPNTYSGGTSITGGTLQIEKAGALGAVTGNVTVASGATLALAGSGTTFAANALTLNGTGVAGNGALYNAAGNNTWTGTVALATDSAIGAAASTTLVVSGVVSGSAALSKVGAGTVALTGTNTYTGATSISGGTLRIGADANLGTAPGTATAGHLALDGGTLNPTATTTLDANRGIALGAGGGTLDTTAGTTLTYNGIAAGTGSLTKAGTGTVVLGGVNTYTGATTVNAGTLRLGGDTELSRSTAGAIASGATLDVNARTDTVGSLAGAGTVAMAGGALTVGANNTSTTFSGVVSGGGTVTKSGTGTLTLSGAANSFAPATLTLAQGITQLGASNVINSAVNFAGGTFSVNGFNDTFTSTTLSASSILDYNSLSGLLNLSTGTYSAGTLTINNWAGSTSGGGASQLLVNSTGALNSTFLSSINFAGYGTGAQIIDRGGGIYEVVPATGTASTWAVDANGNWSTTTNWNPNGTPNGIGATANFAGAITAARTVTQDVAGATVGYVNFTNASNYTLAGANRLTMDVTGGNAQINVSGGGAHSINTGLTLNDHLIINQNSAGTFTLGATNSITGTNRNVTVNGAGNTTITGTLTTGTGTLTKNNDGTLTLASGSTFTGATTINGGTVSLAADTALGTAPGAATAAQLTLNGGTLRNTASMTLATNRGTTLGAAGGTFETAGGTTLTYAGVIAGTSGGALNKTGAGTLLLSGASTYNGATNITAGTLQVSGSNTVLSTGTALTVAAGATFDLTSRGATVGSLAGAGTVTKTSGTTNRTFALGGDNTSTTFSGNILKAGGTGTLALTKNGTGTLTLSGTNTYDAVTTINAGAINAQSNAAFGTSAGGVTVASGAAVELQNNITITGEALTLNGAGVTASPAGALRNVSGSNTWTGAVTLGSASTIRSDSGTLTLTGGITGATFGLTLAGAGNIAESGIIGTTSGTLTKNGTGYVTLSGANTYTGATTINSGTVEIQSSAGLGTNAAGTTIASGATLALSNNISSSEGLTVSGAGVGNSGALRNLSGSNTLTGTVALGAATYVGVDSGSTLTTTGIISGGFDLTKVGTGTLVLNGTANNTYTGTTAVTAGTLELRQAGQLGGGTGVTTVSDGAMLRVNGNALTIAENVTLSGSGVGTLGALQNTGGSNTWSGNLTMAAHSAIGSTAGNTLTATGTLGGAYHLTKVDDGALTLSGANTYTGTTTVRAGTLTLASNAPVAGNGALGNASTAVQLGDASTAGASNVSLLAGGSGGLTIDRAISVNNYGGTVTIGGSNTTGTNTFTGNVAIAKDLSVTAATGGAVVLGGDITGTGNLTKNGTGTLTLGGNNSYTGNTAVSAGTLVAATSNALGGGTGSVTVTSGATLGVQGGVTIPSGQTITLNGTGSGGVGALNNVSGNNTVAGNVALGAATTLGNAAAGTTLTVGGAISGAQNLTTTGAGNFALNGANTFSGSLTLNGSTGSMLSLGASASLANVTALTINAGNTLTLGAGNQINNSANLILAGGTFNVASYSATLNQLSQTVTGSTIDYLNDGSVLRFNANGLGTVTGTLNIANWAGSLGGGGTEQLVVYSTAGAPNVSAINFNGWGAGTATTIARGDLGAGYYEIVPAVTAIDWNVNGNGTWATGTNWVGNTAPNAIGAIARLGNLGSAAPLTTNPTISVNAAATIGTLIFDNSGARNYTINGTNTLTFNVASGAAAINVNDDGAHTISVAAAFADSLNLTNNSTAATGLTISGNLTPTTAGTTLTATGTGHTTISGIIGNNTGTNLLKTGSGTLTLSGTNTYAGSTTLRNGTLELNNSAALGAATTAVTINDASTTGTMNTSLLIGASGVTIARNLTVGTQGATTTLGGSSNFTTGTSTFSGTVTLNKSVDLTAAGTSTVNFNGQLIDGTGTTNITKTGTGTVVLGSAANNYDGSTTINAGTLRLGVANAIPNASAVAVASGATFDLNAFSETVGSLAGAGNVALGSPGAATTVSAGGNNTSTTLSGVMSGGANAAFTKTGTGTMTLSGANTYAGATTVSAGTLIAAHNTALGTSAAGTTVAAGATLGLQGGITVTGESLSVAAATSPSTASLANLSGTNVWTGNVSLTGAVANDQVKIDAAGGSQLTLSGVISEATNAKVVAKTGTGTVVLSGANTYTGSTNVAAGMLVAANDTALGTSAAGTSVQIGATLGVQNNITVASGETFTLYGTVAPPSAPSIKNVQDNNTLNGNITLVGGINTGVAIDSNTGALTLNGAIAQTSNPNYVNKTGSGTLTLGGSSGNTFSGGFNINDGTVIAAKTAGDATGAGAVNIGDGIGAAASATLQLNAGNQINSASNVTIATDGKLDLQSFSNTVGSLTMGGGSVTGTGTATLGGNLTFNGVGSSTASISANVNLGASGTRIVQVGNNGINGDSDLVMSGALSGAAALNKTDLGTLELTGTSANTNSGGFQVSDGTVLLNKTAGTSATGSGHVTIGDSAGAASTANLKLLASNQISDTARVTINSDGKFDLNGLTETIGSFAGTGTIATGSAGLLIAGGDNTSTTFGGTLTGTGTIQKTGSGTLTFNTNISFTGGTLELNGGTLSLAGINLSVGTLHITGTTTLDFGLNTASILSAANVIIDAGVSLTITNWVNAVDYFYATNTFQQFNSGTGTYTGAVIDGRGMAPQNQITFTGYPGNATTWQSFDKQITPAPEPATYGAIFVGAALGFLLWRRRNKPAAPQS
ncbi:MAG: autotransporter-associated beta strand repeat-containing protein [Verrucomicrobia bacterium]|nr:autotransporter-associated beta strand repeat-containing protein [Verrucomicrobiota bacterium]